MKRLCTLSVVGCLFGPLAVAQVEPPEAETQEEAAAEVGTLSLDDRLTFGDLREAGLKFRNSQRAMPQPVRDLRADAAVVRLSRGELESAPMEAFVVHAIFDPHELAEPGEFYPPAAPVQDGTPVATLALQAGATEETVGPLVDGLAEVLGIDATKAKVWLEHDLWELADSIGVSGAIAGGESGLGISRQRDGNFVVSVRVSWPPAEVPEEPVRQRRGRARVLVPGAR